MRYIPRYNSLKLALVCTCMNLFYPEQVMKRFRNMNTKHKSFKYLKFLLILGLTFYLIKYVHVALSKYNQRLVSTNTRVERMSSFDFSSISICHEMGVNETVEDNGVSIRSAFHEMNFNQTNHAMVNITPTLLEEENEVNVFIGIPNNNLWKYHKEIFWMSPYFCSSYSPPAHIKTEFQGLGTVFFMKLFLKREFESLFMFLSHPKLLRTRNLFGGSIYIMNSPEKQKSKSFIFSMKFKKKIILHNEDETMSKEAQCSDAIFEEQQTMEECFKTFMNNKFPCYKDKIHNNATCSKEEEDKMYDLQRLGEAEFVKLTGCPFPCTTYSYDVNLMNTVIAPRSSHPENANIAVYMYISKAAMEISEEFLVYDLESLLGDLGGMVGMLMGLSILAVYEATYEMLLKITERVRKATR